MDGQRYTGLLDMINGGGPGQAGDTFEGGPLSGLLNALGIRPYGYRDRLSEMRPMPRPAGLGVAPRPAPATVDYISQHMDRNAAPTPPQYGPFARPPGERITTTSLPDMQALIAALYQNPELAAALRRQAGYTAPPTVGYGSPQ